MSFTREDDAVLIPSMEMASLGHSATQDPQPVQVSALIFATRSTVMASTGQTWTHIPQPVHLLSSILTAIVIEPFRRSVVFNPRAMPMGVVMPSSFPVAFSGQALENLTTKTILSVLQAFSKHSPTTRKTSSLSPATRVLIWPGTTDTPDFESSLMKFLTAFSIKSVFKG